MIKRVIVMLLALLSVAHAEPPAAVQAEVNFLLGYVEGSGCAFYRNGTWHDSKEAQAHLRDKYQWLAARNLINTAEDFIERAAKQSSFTGRAYKVKCNGGPTITTNQWLRDELTLMRTDGHLKN
ncbi:MAG: hypothetical protein B7Y41_12035 [Hydrogenophilales bacterium 28-61-23]|nr:MAG: hypothetical protein B7Y41_12035 [Hydrogenophilales bacterium 28-61-23]